MAVCGQTFFITIVYFVFDIGVGYTDAAAVTHGQNNGKVRGVPLVIIVVHCNRRLVVYPYGGWVDV